MGTKKSKANGKAKKTERPSFDVALIPYTGRLTPARAKRWLAEDHAGFNLLATNGLRHAEDEQDKDAFEMLAEGLEGMVQACAKAIQTGKPVDVSSNLGPGSGAEMAQASRLLRYPVIARAELAEWIGDDITALGEIAAMVTLRLLEVEKASALDSDARFEIVEAERETDDPHNRMEKIRDMKRDIEKERDAAIEAATADVEKAVEKIAARLAAPFDRQLEHLKYEDDWIWHRCVGLENEGKPPRGWKPVTGSEVLKRVRATAGGTA